MVIKKDYYEVLGISHAAGTDEIKKAFRKLAFECHPDRNHEDGATERFKEINEAYEVLSDTHKRARYDRLDHFGYGRSFDGFDDFMGGLGDVFEAFFSGTTTTRVKVPRQGSDLTGRLSLSFEEAAFGCEKEIEIERTEACSNCRGVGAEPGSQLATCPACGGTGEILRAQHPLFGRFVNRVVCERCRGEGTTIERPCKQCKGTGRERQKRNLMVKVPAGVDAGSQIRLRGEGEVGNGGGPPGDLYISLAVREHEYFRRDGNDVIYELPLNFAQAALGDEIDIPSLDGPTSFKIPPGTQSGEVFRLKKKGVTDLHGRGRGDQLVKVRLVTPEKLSREQRRLFQELSGVLEGSPLIDRRGKGIFGRKKKDSNGH